MSTRRHTLLFLLSYLAVELLQCEDGVGQVHRLEVCQLWHGHPVEQVCGVCVGPVCVSLASCLSTRTYMHTHFQTAACAPAMHVFEALEDAVFSYADIERSWLCCLNGAWLEGLLSKHDDLHLRKCLR